MESALKDKVVLVVDDYAINRELFCFFVEEIGGNYLSAPGGQQCLDILQKHHVDLILMDRKMPQMDGIATTMAIRSLPIGKDVVIVGITGCEEESEIRGCLNAGMNRAISKISFSIEKLEMLAEEFFGKSNSQSKAPPKSNAISIDKSFGVSENATVVTVMNYDKALEEFDNDSELLNSLLKEFIKVLQQQRILMQQALSDSDIDCIQREAHSIKGGAANLCALPLSGSAKALEQSCKQNATNETLTGLLDNLFIAIESFELFVKDKLQL